MGRIVGYVRVSTDHQNLDLQLDALRAAGVSSDDVYRDEGVSGATASRPGLDAMLEAVKDGDTITVWRLDRLGRSVLNLAELSRDLRERGVGIKSLTDGVDTSTPTGRMMMGLLSTLAEYEREIIRERINAGIEAARKRGKHLGRKFKLDEARTDFARKVIAGGKSLRQTAFAMGTSPSVLCRSLQRWPDPATTISGAVIAAIANEKRRPGRPRKKRPSV